MTTIIVCKDCKHYIPHDKRCNYWNHGVEPSEWCCHAEKEMVMEKLKPCPFCGMPYTELYWVTTEKRGFDTLGIFCNNCKQTVTLEENEWEGDTSDTKRKAIKAWNRRAGEQDE